MISDDEIKRIINLSIEDLDKESVRNSLDVIQRFIFDKKGEEISYVGPMGQISIPLTSFFMRPVVDYEILEYLYAAAITYYKKTLC